MNKTNFLQRDGRWGGLPYPKSPCYIRSVGCGEVSIANVLIEMEQYKNYTPATIQPYCKRYGAPNCDGTYLSGICAMMKHYGMTDVKECATMPELWKELEKGNRVAIYLMGSRLGGSKKIHWTDGGHFVASVDYKYEDKKHKVYMKDPWTKDKNRNGWISYEENMKNDVVAVYVGKLVQKKAKPSDGKLSVDGVGGEATIKATQKFFGVDQNGIISSQMEKLYKYYPSITAVKFAKKAKGSPTIKALQKWLGLTQDGIIGKGTTAAWQKKLRDYGYLAKDEKIDGLFGVKSMKAWQKFLNEKLFGDTTDDSTKKPNETSATTPTASTYKVIDVSDWQSKIDWAKVKADGVVGAIIRYADGDTLDKRFAENMENAKKVGLHIGCYIFSRAKTKTEARKEAERLYKASKKYEPDMPLYIDLEVASLSKYANTVAQAFLNKMNSLGAIGGVYANLNWWNNYLVDTLNKYSTSPFWIAQYNDEMTHKNPSLFGMWQYSSSGKVNGISGRVDMNKCYVAYWDAVTNTEETPKEDVATDVEAPSVEVDPLQPWYDALKEQYEHSKDQTYKFNTRPTVANSKEEGTCITFVAVALQRLGLLPKGKWFWLYPKTKKIDGNGEGYVEKHPEIYEVCYPWKTIAELWKEGKIKKGDIIGFDDPDHTMVFKGFNDKNEPIFDTMGHKRGLNVTYPSYAKRKVGMIVRLKKVVK